MAQWVQGSQTFACVKRGVANVKDEARERMRIVMWVGFMLKGLVIVWCGKKGLLLGSDVAVDAVKSVVFAFDPIENANCSG